MGVSAISHVGDTYSQNPRDLPSWEIAIDEGRLPTWRGMALDADDALRADLIQQLMCHGSVEFAPLELRHAIDFREYFAEDLGRLAPLVADGLVVVESDRVRATERRRLLVRIIAACFDRYPHQAQAAPVRFSKAI